MRRKEMIVRTLVCVAGLFLAACQSMTPRTWDLPPGIKTLQVNGYEMAYSERGSGVSVVFVHGSVSDYRWWIPQVEPFAGRYRTVAVSLRHHYPERWNGKGDSFTLARHADDLASFIRSLNAGKVHVVALSRGATVALRMAVQNPELLRSLVLADPAPLDTLVPATPQAASEAENRRQFVTAAIEQLDKGNTDAGLERFVEGVAAPGVWKNFPEPQKQTLRDNAWSLKSLLADPKEPVTCGDVGRINVPVLFTTGETSPGIYRAMIEGVQKCARQHESATIPNAGHAMNRMNPPAFNSVVMDFLSKH
jgi:esterase